MIEEHVEHSNALHARLRERGAYLVGPMARYNLNFERLSPLAREAAREAGLGAGVPQPVPEHRRARRRGPVRVRRGGADHRRVRAARRAGGRRSSRAPARATAARRRRAGCCTTRYELDDDGTIVDAKIVPPTSQNQKSIEEDLFGVVSADDRRAGGGTAAALRAGDPQLRPVHLLRDALPAHRCRARRSGAVVIGVGNSWAGDDAAGVLVARLVRGRVPRRAWRWPSTRASRRALLDVWEGARAGDRRGCDRRGGPTGAVRLLRRHARAAAARASPARSTHAFSLAQAIELGARPRAAAGAAAGGRHRGRAASRPAPSRDRRWWRRSSRRRAGAGQTRRAARGWRGVRTRCMSAACSGTSCARSTPSRARGRDAGDAVTVRLGPDLRLTHQHFEEHFEAAVDRPCRRDRPDDLAQLVQRSLEPLAETSRSAIAPWSPVRPERPPRRRS